MLISANEAQGLNDWWFLYSHTMYSYLLNVSDRINSLFLDGLLLLYKCHEAFFYTHTQYICIYIRFPN